MRQTTLSGLIVVLFVVAALGWSWYTREEKGVSQLPVKAGLDDGYRDLRREVRLRFQEAADRLNAEAPTRVNEHTFLQKAEVGDGPSMIYRYQVLQAAAGDMEKNRDRAEQALVDQVCSIPEMRDYMQYGIHYVYIYTDEAGRELCRFKVDEDLCKAAEKK